MPIKGDKNELHTHKKHSRKKLPIPSRNQKNQRKNSAKTLKILGEKLTGEYKYDNKN